MRLSDYMAEQGLTDEAFALRIGRDRSFVTKIRQGRALPSLKTAMAIFTATGGAVTVDDIFRRATDMGPPPQLAEGVVEGGSGEAAAGHGANVTPEAPVVSAKTDDGFA